MTVITSADIADNIRLICVIGALIMMDCILMCRGYLAKGAVYKSQGRKSDAQRMFIQARYLAPGNVKPLVERLSVM